MGDEWQSTTKRPILNLFLVKRQSVRKSMICMMKSIMTNPKDPRSQQSWVKTFMQDVMDEKGQVLFDNLSWFAKKLCSVMTSASACENMCSIEGWIHNKCGNRLPQPNVERAVCAYDNLVLRKVILLSKDH
jgi:hypothetical protein